MKQGAIDSLGLSVLNCWYYLKLIYLYFIADNQIPKNLIRPLVLPVAQTPSSSRDTLASALALTSPEINVHSACCVSVKLESNITSVYRILYIYGRENPEMFSHFGSLCSPHHTIIIKVFNMNFCSPKNSKGHIINLALGRTYANKAILTKFRFW